jgi:pilus assembly protein Flp/PilA
MRLLSRLFRFVRNEDGPTAVEYAVMLSLIVVVCIYSVDLMGRQTRRDYRSVSRTLQKANTAGS